MPEPKQTQRERFALAMLEQMTEGDSELLSDAFHDAYREVCSEAEDDTDEKVNHV